MFNSIAHAATKNDPAEGLEALDDLIAIARRHPDQQGLIALAAEGAFAMVTGLGTRGHLDPAERSYRALTALSRLPEAGLPVRRRLAEAAFNLITDLCEADTLGEAQLIYDELTSLSVYEDDDPTIRLAQAKASANMALTWRQRGEHMAAAVAADDLKALLHAHPDDQELFEVAAFLDMAD